MTPLLLAACADYNLKAKEDGPVGMRDSGETADPGGETGIDDICEDDEYPVESVPLSDTCQGYDIGAFEPIVEWDVPGEYSCSLPAVGDLDLDGRPEIVVNFAWVLSGAGELAVYRGDGSGLLWETRGAETGFGAAPAIADLDGDGYPEVLIVRQYQSSLFGSGEFTVVAYDYTGAEIAESAHYVDAEFDYATSIAVSDMDHDGSPEVVAGRVILNADLTERGVGQEGRGCPAYVGIFTYGEGASPAIADLDLDGEEEVIVGNAWYDADGRTVLNVRGGSDGAVAVGELDGDPEGEFVRSMYSEIQAYDTDGTTLWGPVVNKSANILAIPAIADVDNDGLAEVITAGGDELWVMNGEDGSILWKAAVTDKTGATGASTFDFDGDGILEVVYIDEVEMIAYNGTDGTIKFHSTEHGSDTMYDYPVIADVDADGHAEIVVVHDGYSSGLSVYGDATDSWAPARSVWNQHAYTITNIDDDLSVPTTATQNFTVYNSFHSALAGTPGDALAVDLEAEILGTCDDECDDGWFRIAVRGRNVGANDVEESISISVYAREDGDDTLLSTQTTTSATASGMTTEALTFDLKAEDVRGADGIYVEVDDNGTGTSLIPECSEENNGAYLEGPFCD